MPYLSKPLAPDAATKRLLALGLSSAEAAAEVADLRKAAAMIVDIAGYRTIKRAKTRTEREVASLAAGSITERLRATSKTWSRWYSEITLRMGAIGSLLSSRLRSMNQLDAEYYRLNGVSDMNQTPFCRSVDGFTELVTNWPGWLFPGFHWGCRTLLQRLTTEQVGRAGFRVGGELGEERPAEGFGTETTLLDELRAHANRARSEAA